MPALKNLFLSISSFLISLALTPMTVPLCRVIGAIDIPDGRRKINESPTPRLGGLGFFFAAFIILLPLAAKDAHAAALLAAGSLLVAGGIADDTYSLSPFFKLLIQIACALSVIFFIGIPKEFSFLGIIRIPLVGAVGFLFTLFRVVFTINAVNFCDGLDGLASGLSLVALLSLAAFGYAAGNDSPALCALILSAAILGFLPYNKYHARVFMGDCGSQFLGLAIAVLSLGCAPGCNFTLETSLFLAVPTADTVASVIRRLLKRKSPFSADKGHLHHILLDFGIPHPVAVKILVSASALVAATALIFIY